MKKFSSILIKALMAFVFVGMAACSSDELVGSELEQGKAVGKTVEVDVHIEGSAEVEGTTRAGGGLYLKYADQIPLFHMKDDNATVEAHCVFKPLKEGSKTELDNSKALYGTLVFKRKPGSEPEMENGKAVAVKILCEGKVTLHGNAEIKPGEKWYVMGLVGGQADEKGEKVDVNGFHAMFQNNDRISGIDKSSGSAPFLSKWVELEPIREVNKVESGVPMNFNFQGILFTVDMKNGTDYKFNPTFLQIQSTELTSYVSYDLTASNNVNDSEDAFKWENKEPKDALGRWYVTGLNLLDSEYDKRYILKPKSEAQDKNYLYDAKYLQDGKATLLFWANTINEEEFNKAKLPPRTGFFLSCENTEAKKAWTEKIVNGKVELEENRDKGNFKYVLTSDKTYDDILGYCTDDYLVKTGEYSADIKPAPSMKFFCAKAIQRSLRNNRGKYVHLTLSVPERPVMPIETMAQKNLYGYKEGKTMNFVRRPGDDKGTYSYIQYGDYAKDFADNSDKNNYFWKLPTLGQWAGMLLTGHNNDNAHNWNANAYDWIEGEGAERGIEPIEFSDGTKKTFYAVYHRTPKGNENDHKIYGLRFFGDAAHTKGTDYFSLTRYVRTAIKGNQVLSIETVWLGPEYAKLYEGIYSSVGDWIKEIAANDNQNEQSLFRKLRQDFVTRNLLLETTYSSSQYSVYKMPQDYSYDMIGYFYGPASNFTSYRHAKAIAYNHETLFTGPTASQNFDFTDFFATKSVTGFVRPMRRNFMKFGY